MNFCDASLLDTWQAGYEVLDFLEDLKLTYTGAKKEFYQMTKLKMKELCSIYGIPTANYL